MNKGEDMLINISMQILGKFMRVTNVSLYALNVENPLGGKND